MTTTIEPERLDRLAREHAELLTEIDRAPNSNCPVCTRAVELGLLEAPVSTPPPVE